MATSTINDQLVLRVDTFSGETTVTMDIPRDCKISEIVATPFVDGGVVPTPDCNVQVLRLRSGAPFQYVTTDLTINSISFDSPGDPNFSYISRMNNVFPDGLDLKAGDQLQFTKSATGPAGSIFVFVSAPGVSLTTSAI